MGHTAITRALGATRMAVGLSTLLAPAAAGRAFGLGRMGDDPAAALVARLFGVRDLALGAAVLFAPDEPRLRQALALGVACDSVDVGSSALARRAGLPAFGSAFAGVGAALLAAAGVAGLARTPDEV